MDTLKKKLGEKFEKDRLTPETLKLSQELDILVVKEQRRRLENARVA